MYINSRRNETYEGLTEIPLAHMSELHYALTYSSDSNQNSTESLSSPKSSTARLNITTRSRIDELPSSTYHVNKVLRDVVIK